MGVGVADLLLELDPETLPDFPDRLFLFSFPVKENKNSSHPQFRIFFK